MVLLAVASLAVIPAMVAASGATAWGLIAVGQSIGGIGAVLVAYGWGLSGPAAIARAGEDVRLAAYLESVLAKLILFLPVAAAAVGVAVLVAGPLAVYAAVGAVSAASIGLTANWYFVGTSSPYRFLLLETVPRVAGTAAGIGFMVTGSDALVGVVWQLLGMLGAFAVCSVWILRPWRWSRLRAAPRRPMPAVLGSQRNGIVSSVLSSVYSAAPLVIVTLIAPAAQPVYAVVEKVQRQVIVALQPLVTFLQGWIPRAAPPDLGRHIRSGLLGACAFAVVLGLGMAVVAPDLVLWLGSGQIVPSFPTLLLMAVITSVSLFESVTSKAALPALGRLDMLARSTLIGTLVGLPLVAVGALFLGAPGALLGILAGLLLRVALELASVRSASRRPAVADLTTELQAAP